MLISGLEIKFLEHWQADHQLPKSGGPLPFLVVLSDFKKLYLNTQHFYTIFGREILVACHSTATHYSEQRDNLFKIF